MYHYHFVLIAFNFFIIIFIPTKEDECLQLPCEAAEQECSLQLITFVHFAGILHQLPWISILLQSNISFILKIITNNLCLVIPLLLVFSSFMLFFLVSYYVQSLNHLLISPDPFLFCSAFVYFNPGPFHPKKGNVKAKKVLCVIQDISYEMAFPMWCWDIIFPFLSRVTFIHAKSI